MPRKVKYAYAECSTDWLLAGLSSGDRQALDEFARGDRTMTAADYGRIEQTIQPRLAAIDGMNSTTWGILSQVCPDQIPDFRRYFPD